MEENESLYAIALTLIKGLGPINCQHLYDAFGSATAIYEHRSDLLSHVPDASPHLISLLQQYDAALPRAEQELAFAQKKNVKVITFADQSYPQRLRTCADAPVVLYYCGNADLNKVRVISMVGTRKITEYGKELCANFVSDLHRYYPDTLIVSGLAYGVDIHSHRAALLNGMDTVGVLAHGLDRIYPSVHRATAVEMVSHGGLLTEYLSGTAPERTNFLSRNRIVAGMCDACVVVQSAARGGSLITARLAQAYSRELCTFPGRVNDEFSVGCNRLISDGEAHLITSAEDFLKAVNWPDPLQHQGPVQQELFLNLSDDEQLVLDTLKGHDELPINAIVQSTGLTFSTISVILFTLEMRGIVRSLGGARYKICW